jgi:hypothetical protein
LPIELTEVELNEVSGGTTQTVVTGSRSNIKNNLPVSSTHTLTSTNTLSSIVTPNPFEVGPR